MSDAKPTTPRPRIVLSQCLELDACRYNGQKIPDSFVRRLLDFVDAVPVCPEVEIGLGVPRDPIRLVDGGDRGTRLVQPSSGADVTEAMSRFAEGFLASLQGVDGFVLKSRSPSCGPKDVKIYAGEENAPPTGKQAGLFAEAVQDRFGDLAIEDEGRLRDFRIRDHFLIKLYALTALRQLGEQPSMRGLVDFHSRYKLLLLVYDQEAMRSLGRIVANHEGLPPDEVYSRYRDGFRAAFSEIARRRAHLNALTHGYGHFREELPADERDLFHQMLDEFAENRLPLSAPVAILRSWCARFENEYLRDQAYLEPYPRDLIEMRDSGKGVDF